jgi:hypothetical protein
LLKSISRVLTVAITVALLAAAVVVGPAAAQSRVARVAVIVGPAGDVTARYRALADEAASAARAAGAEVVTVYSPDATWPAVKRAVEGASIVVYLGHGNGWPSPYRDSLYPRSQNGFGLNPVAGRNDRDHQYFGESSIQRLRFASNAIVVFSHLCYASGNSEPGLAEGTADVAVQRVDNYAAGFLRAGAGAVIAETALGPAYYVKSILKGRGSVQAIWDSAPTANGHTFAVNSTRSPGYAVQLDPNRQSSGFVRSLVTRGGVTAAQVRAGATGTPGTVGPAPVPSLASKGVRFSEATLAALPIAGTATTLTLPLAKGHISGIPAGTEVSIRWDPLVVSRPSTAAQSAAPAPSEPPQPGLNWAVPTPTPLPPAPEVDLVVPEQNGSVVEPVAASRGDGGLRVTVTYPAAPGLYRLSTMLHTPEGVAYDDATQNLLTPVLVTVGGPIAAAYGAPSSISLEAGSSIDLPVRVMNAGSQRWDMVETAPRSQVAGEPQLPSHVSTIPAKLVATWVSADGHAVPDPVTVNLADTVAGPGGSAEALVGLTAPADGGDYLLLLDVLSPVNGPLSALGSQPAMVRISVAGAEASASPAPIAIPSPVVPPVLPAASPVSPLASPQA